MTDHRPQLKQRSLCWTRRLRWRAVLLLTVAAAATVAHAQSGGWTVRVLGDATPIGDCEALGFPNATRNACDFCTGGATGLGRDHGRDCAGHCNGLALPDCNGACGGKAYLDECSGVCIGGSTGRTVKDVASFRDCRGYCTSSGGQYFTDSCGVCHTGASPFQDCTNRCHLPGEESAMARLLCGRCVGGGTGGVSESEVVDSCGNCRSEVLDCPCNGTGKADLCGVCNGRGQSCMRVQSFHPRAVPLNINANVLIEGAFRGRTRNLKCVFRVIRPPNDLLGNRTEFTAAGNGSHVQCRVRLPAGSYRVGVKLDVGSPPETDFVEEAEFLVYDEADYGTMSPGRVVFDRDGAKELTVTFSGGRVPPLPLTCIITGEDWPLELRLAPSAANTLDTCVIPYANASTRVQVAPSLNGFHPFPTSFPLQFFASPPEMRKYYIAEDGHAVMVVFDREVNLCQLDGCARILNNETLERLGEGATCRWATKQQLIITVHKPIAGNPIRVTFKKGVLKQDGQKYAQPKNDSLTIDAWYPEPVSMAQVTISGPSTVSECGQLVLVGHFSSPKGDAAFYWTAFRGDGRNLEAVIANALLLIRSATLTLDVSLLEVGMNYSFILTAEHPVNEKYEARHGVVRRPHAGPFVTAYSDSMTQSSVTVDQKIVLHADVSIPLCIAETEMVHLMWSVDNLMVKFDFKNKMSQVYKIEPYSLPENSEVTFTATAFFGHMLNATTSKITLRVEPIKLRASIKGASKRITGNRNATLVLESDNLNRGTSLVYQWRCYDENRVICYDYRKNGTEPLLVPPRLQNRPRLEIRCDSLRAGDALTFELQLFNARNRDQYSQSASVLVLVRDGAVPQVAIDSVVVDGANFFHRHPTTGAFNIPAGLAVTVHATVKQTTARLTTVRWDVKGFSAPYTFSALNGKTFINLGEGFLVGHGIYLIGLSACDLTGSCGVANLTIHAMPGIALCRLQMAPHVEYEQVSVSVVGCSIPPGRQPVTYQLFVHDAPLTPPQTSTVFNIVAPPQQLDGWMRMSVEVCDKYTICDLYSGPAVSVTASENRMRDRRQLVERAQKAIKINDPMTALSLYLTASLDPKVPLADREMDGLIEAASRSTTNRYVSAGQLSLLYSAMLPLLRQDDRLDVKGKALAAIRAGTRLAFGHQVKVPTSVLSRGHSNAAEALQCPKPDPEVTGKVKDTLTLMVEKIGAALPLGNRVLLESPHPGYPATLVFRSLLDQTPIRVRARGADGVVEGSVAFEEAINERFRKRTCKKRPDCEGAVVALTLFPGRSPQPSSGDRRSSPVLDITLRRPEDGNPVRFKDMPDAIRMALTHTDNSTVPVRSGMVYRCVFWDEGRDEWAGQGVVTAGVEDGLMNCLSSHLSSFTVMEMYDGLSTGSIVGITVASLIGVFIILMFVFFFFRKKQARAARVSTEALQPEKRPPGKPTNGHVARVKGAPP